jgi:glycosyl transferase family 2
MSFRTLGGSQRPRIVSLVIETESDEPGHRIRLTDAILAWRSQTAADRIAEWIVVASRSPSSAERSALADLPFVWLERPGLRYHQNKNAGVAVSRGSFVALADSDVLPARDWLERGLAALETTGPRVALVTGRTAYAQGPFSRELALAQWPNHGPEAADVTHFLAHNLLLRGDVARRFPFPESQAELRHGPDSSLAEHLRAEGWTLRYDPSLAMTHNAATSLHEVWRHCLAHGHTEARFRHGRGGPEVGPLREAVGRLRLLTGRLLHRGADVGIGAARLPFAFAFFAAFTAALAAGRRKAERGEPEVLEPF